MKSVSSIADVGEFGLIGRLAKLLPTSGGVIGIGDDTAVLPLGIFASTTGGATAAEGSGWLLFTVDAMVEDQHFRRSYGDPFSVGWKLLAVSISDVAAMGGEPRAAVINLALPSECDVAWVEGCYRGVAALAKQEGVQIVGGDTVAAREVSLSLSLLGYTATPPLLRSAAGAGHDVWISGRVGDAGAGLRLFENTTAEVEANVTANVAANITTASDNYRERFLRPTPRTRLGVSLAEKGLAKAMIDVSDGLFQDLAHIASQSFVDIELDPTLIPVSSAVSHGLLTLAEACTAGEDYELVWTAGREQRRELELLPDVTRIGCVRPVVEGSPGVFLCSQGQRVKVVEWLGEHGGSLAGFDHFRGRK